MPIRHNIFILLGAFLCLVSCERDADLDLLHFKPELVVMANFSQLDTLEVVVSQTQPVLDESQVIYIRDAVVRVYANDFFSDSLHSVSSPALQIPPFYRSSYVVPKAGVLYRVVVDAPGFEPVEGESMAPFPVSIDTGFTSIVIEKEQTGPDLALARIRVGLKILDVSGVENYYHLNFFQEGSDFQIDQDGDTIKFPFISLPLGMKSEDEDVPLIPYIESRGMLFTDEALSGNGGVLHFEVTFQYRSQDQLLEDFLIELRTVSPEYYLYHRSLARQHQAGQHPFSEPVILYSNIKNGHGIFGGFTTQFYRVDTTQ